MMLEPFCQSPWTWRLHGPDVKSFVNDMRKLGVASPTTTSCTPPVVSLPTICVAEAPFAMRNAPRLTPNPPARNDGTGMLSIVERVREKFKRENHSNRPDRTGTKPSEISAPVVCIVPALKTSVVKPDDDARARWRSRSLMFLRYRVN